MISGDNSLGNSGIYYLADHLYVIGTMNKSRWASYLACLVIIFSVTTDATVMYKIVTENLKG